MNNYWNRSGRHQELADKLSLMVPSFGSVASPRKNKALEKFRKARNCYYDLYNNGLCNRADSFRKVFKITSSEYHTTRGEFRQVFYTLTENKLNHFIIEAALEQKLIADVRWAGLPWDSDYEVLELTEQ